MMEAETIAWIVGSVLTALGAGVSGGRYLFPKFSSGQDEHLSLGNPNQLNPLDVVTESECRELRRELADSFVKNSDEVKAALNKQTDTLNSLTQAVTKLETKVDMVPVEIENASMKAIRSHENKLHSRPSSDMFSDVERGSK